MENSPEAVTAFIERMGLSAQADGLPRIAGRMLGYFIIHGGPASLAQLAIDLQVSRASVSTNARILSGLGVLEATAVPGDRQDYYRLAEQHYLRMLEGYVERMGTLRDSLARAERDLPDDWDGARERLADMHNFVDVAREHTGDLIARLGAAQNPDTRD
ncbi:GbsR/MarR family transcriptional regulator [Salinisphaera aquimarina]|uniref:GbsR/MarR family transcriptional regulator n=1 Tax=Salinisphaera aquimarina TaxID=2094031 RepID=A0ABV7ES99_9GAMM